MEKKNMIIIGVIVVIIAIVGVIFATGALNKNEVKTPFETDFISGSFVGNVSQTQTNESYAASFTDSQNGITYNFTTMDNSTALMEIYKFQGVQGPEQRTINGNDWNIYFAQAMPAANNTTSQANNHQMGVIICESQKESQGYVLSVIFEDLNKVNYTLNTFGDSYVKFVEPMLKTINLKQSDNVPAVHEQFGMSKDDFNKQIELIHQVQAGNYSALQG